MNKKLPTIRKITLLSMMLCSFVAQSQNVAINGTGAAPNASAGLDIDFTNRGLLIPRVALTARNNNAPIGATITTGLMVYNTATAGAAPNNVVPGFYYWNGTSWIAFGGTGGNDWSLTGNSGTAIGTNFLGTTDNVAFSIRTNNAERIRITNTGEVGLSGVPTAPYALGAGVPVHCIYYPLEVGNDGNTGAQVTIGYYRGTDPTVNPEQLGGWGYVGYNAAGAGNNQYWWRGYSGGWVNVSQRELKRDIIALKENANLENYIVNNILNMKPSLYNYKNEYDEMISGKENHYRPAYRIGLIADESPDYILDESFSGVDIYGLATMSLVGAQYSIKEINKIKESTTISDFGTGTLTTSSNSTWVQFSENFNGKIPVVTITSNDPEVSLSVIEKNDKGFKVVSFSNSKQSKNISFDWIAMAKNNSKEINDNIDISVKNKLVVPANTKSNILNFYSDFKPSIDIKK